MLIIQKMSKWEEIGEEVKNNYLKLKVYQIINDYLGCYGENDQKKCLKMFFKDFQRMGCASGMIIELIYYTDTKIFFAKYQDEINNVLYETMRSLGSTGLKDLFGEKYDEDDPLCLENQNINLIVWFAVEEVAFDFQSQMEL